MSVEFFDIVLLVQHGVDVTLFRLSISITTVSSEVIGRVITSKIQREIYDALLTV